MEDNEIATHKMVDAELAEHKLQLQLEELTAGPGNPGSPLNPGLPFSPCV